MVKVIVTGANGQLGQAIRHIAHQHPEVSFFFYGSSELDITDAGITERMFAGVQPDYCINAAAYTAVDKAESEPEKAFAINRDGAANLAHACKAYDTVLLHVSTDFVFDGNHDIPYTETDEPNPTGVYGQTKLDGEREIQRLWHKHYIIRTSWVYSQFGNNFMKTMLRLGKERPELAVVADQTGTPTNANDLAAALLAMIARNTENPSNTAYGIYNFSNSGRCSWYEFASEIFALSGMDVIVRPIPTSGYPTPAKRPAYSVLSKNKIKALGIRLTSWQTSLKEVLATEM